MAPITDPTTRNAIRYADRDGGDLEPAHPPHPLSTRICPSLAILPDLARSGRALGAPPGSRYAWAMHALGIDIGGSGIKASARGRDHGQVPRRPAEDRHPAPGAAGRRRRRGEAAHHLLQLVRADRHHLPRRGHRRRDQDRRQPGPGLDRGGRGRAVRHGDGQPGPGAERRRRGRRGRDDVRRGDGPEGHRADADVRHRDRQRAVHRAACWCRTPSSGTSRSAGTTRRRARPSAPRNCTT